METLCRAVMDRGRFPCAHSDLHLGEGGACHVSEIALDGGIAGAIINRAVLNRRKQAVLERMAEER